MRRRIRLTGRRQIHKSAVNVELIRVGGKPIVAMAISKPAEFSSFPSTARLSIRLVENKGVEVLDFGMLGKPRASCHLQTQNFVAPSCQLRIADASAQVGLLLGSTDTWTLRPQDDDQANSRGILKFLAADTAPLTWTLDIKENDYPVVKVDKRIPNATAWARTDAIFLSLVFPAVVRRIFDEILRENYSYDADWVADWLKWGAWILPDVAAPIGEDDTAHAEYIDRLLASFCERHGFANKLLAALQPGEG
jgi:hypothetical protein